MHHVIIEDVDLNLSFKGEVTDREMKAATLRRYGLAVLLCGVALALALPSDAPSSCFFLAVMTSSLWGGKRPGFLSVGFSAIAFDYFFLPAPFQLFASPSSLLRFAVFLGATSLVAAIIEIKRRIEESRSSERKEGESALRKSESYLTEAQKLSHTGSWAWDVNRRETTYWSAEMFRIYARDPSGGLPSPEELSALHTPEAWRSLRESAERSIQARADIDHIYRLVMPNGSSKHIRIVGHPVVNTAGEVFEIFGTAVDITEQYD